MAQSGSHIPRTIRRFSVVQEIGRGGMGIVYMVHDPHLDRQIALKSLPASYVNDEKTVARFITESRIAAKLRHPNIVQVYDGFVENGEPYIVMEYVPGGSLQPRMGTLAPEQIGLVLHGVLAGLDYAADGGVVHRDLKPANILVENRRVKITDYGIAKVLGQDSGTRTGTGSVLGTPAYMAPEQALGAEIGPKADLYAVGTIAFELLVGRLPFAQDQHVAMMTSKVMYPAPDPLSLKPDLDPALADWLRRMLATDPADRPASADDAWEELDPILCHLLGTERWQSRVRLLSPYELSTPSRTPGRTPAPGPGAKVDQTYLTRWSRQPEPELEPGEQLVTDEGDLIAPLEPEVVEPEPVVVLAEEAVTVPPRPRPAPPAEPRRRRGLIVSAALLGVALAAGALATAYALEPGPKVTLHTLITVPHAGRPPVLVRGGDATLRYPPCCDTVDHFLAAAGQPPPAVARYRSSEYDYVVAFKPPLVSLKVTFLAPPPGEPTAESAGFDGNTIQWYCVTLPGQSQVCNGGDRLSAGGRAVLLRVKNRLYDGIVLAAHSPAKLGDLATPAARPQYAEQDVCLMVDAGQQRMCITLGSHLVSRLQFGDDGYRRVSLRLHPTPADFARPAG